MTKHSSSSGGTPGISVPTHTESSGIWRCEEVLPSRCCSPKACGYFLPPPEPYRRTATEAAPAAHQHNPAARYRVHQKAPHLESPTFFGSPTGSLIGGMAGGDRPTAAPTAPQAQGWVRAAAKACREPPSPELRSRQHRPNWNRVTGGTPPPPPQRVRPLALISPLPCRKGAAAPVSGWGGPVPPGLSHHTPRVVSCRVPSPFPSCYLPGHSIVAALPAPRALRPPRA